MWYVLFFFFFQAEDGIRDWSVTGVQTCALPIWLFACLQCARRPAARRACAQYLAPRRHRAAAGVVARHTARHVGGGPAAWLRRPRSEEHTSELQSLTNLVCRLLLEKKKRYTACQ